MPPSEPRVGEARRLSKPVFYSLLVHAVLIVALIFGIDWRNEQPEGIAVELWDALPARVAKTEPVRPEPPPPPPEPEPEVKRPELRPEQQPRETKPEPRAEKLREDAEIKRRAEAKREQRRREQAEAKKLADAKIREQAKAKKLAEEKKREERALAERKEADRKRRLEQEKARDDARKKELAKQREERLAREREEERALSEARAAAEQRALEAARAGQLKASDQAIVDEYKRKIRNKILANVIAPPDLSGNPEAVFEVIVLPGGDVLRARLIKPSGNAAWDAAVERAITKSQPLPLPPNPELFAKFRELNLRFKPS